ncbi:MAG: hypothetical protein HKN22_04705, partial [Bacteroidia bacterium]|nr:hypothetical protein [Bacteroidia bacterium]
MKKNFPILIIAIALLSVAAYLILSKEKSTISEELSDFAVTDTAAVDKVFLADKTGLESHRVLLERDPDGSGWIVNKKFEARKDAIDLLLHTISAIEVRSPVAKAAYENVMKRLASNGIKIEIYKKGKLDKTYYVGNASADQMGTFMYLENSSVPFVVHIPGFNGYLTPRYSCESHVWKTKTVFKAKGPEIASIKVEYRAHPQE